MIILNKHQELPNFQNDNKFARTVQEKQIVDSLPVKNFPESFHLKQKDNAFIQFSLHLK